MRDLTTRSAVLLALCMSVALAAAVNPANPSGKWKYPTIRNLTTTPEFNEEHVLYATYNTTAAAWTSMQWSPAQGLVPTVLVSRNQDVQNWDYIKFTSLNYVDAYYTAGWAEGFLSYATIYNTYVNQVKMNAGFLASTPAAQAFMAAHIQYERDHETETPFGQQLARQIQQVDGIYDGYVAGFNAAGSSRPANVTMLSPLDIYLISYMNEIDNVLDKFSNDRRRRRATTGPKPFNSSSLHCSALMKLTSDDLFFAHDTWSGFNTMIRQYKTYVMPQATIVMTSYPGSISSIDDWYMSSHDLAITETTNGFSNNTLLQFIRPASVSEFHRAMIGNFLATSPLEWMQIFNTSNSGTYNNQYMVADMKAARAAIAAQAPLPAGTFYVGEQLPGIVFYADQTEFLNTNKHWPSYNIPYYPQIQKISGYEAEQGPSYYGENGYNTYSRAVIFKRMQGEVTDLVSMFYLMRYNNFQNDPASTLPWCKTSWNPNGTTNCPNNTQGSGQTIASRFDLNTPTASPDGDNVGTRRVPFGAVDTKVTSAKMMAGGAFRAIAINGPTRVQQPAWDYDAFIARNPEWTARPYVGLPSVFDFAPVFFGTAATTTTPAPSSVDSASKVRHGRRH